MTWGEIQIESLKKMFSNKDDLSVDSLEEYKKTKAYKLYLFAMAQATNEAINYIVNLLGSNQKIEKLTKTNDALYNLQEIFKDYKLLNEIIVSEGNVSYERITKNIIQINNWTNEEVKVLYEVKPTVINSSTQDSHKIEIEEEYARIIPLYVAGELYKDDDLTIATMYMNEFISMMNTFVTNKKDFVIPSFDRVFEI